MRSLIFCACLIIALPLATNADVTLKRETTIDNLMGIGSTKSTETQYIKGDRSCDETETAFTSGLMKMTTGGKSMRHSTITRLDRQLIWDIEPDEKKYSEMTFAKFKQMLEQSLGKGSDPQLGEETDYQWKVEVKTGAGNEKINGFDCRLIEGKAVGVNKKAPSDTIIINIKNWNSKGIAGIEEYNIFMKNYMNAIGLDESAMQKGLQAFVGAYRGQFNELMNKLKEEDGFPVRSTVLIESSSAKGEKQADTDEDLENPEQGAPAQILGKLGKLGGKSNKDKSSDSGRATLLSVTTDLKSIDSKPIDEGKFEVPAGFTKKEIK